MKLFGKNKIEISAILDTDIENLLKETNQFEDFINGKLKCRCCGETLTVENIGIILPVNVDSNLSLEFYCENVLCLQKYNTENGK